MQILGTGLLAPVQNLASSSSRPTSPTSLALSKQHQQEVDNKAGQSHTIERNDLHKSLKALEAVLVAVDEYRDLKSRLAKSEKRLAKSLNELGKTKALEEVPANTILASSLIFEGINEVQSKHVKMVQKEYEALNEHCARYFKKIAKEEKAHDDQVEVLDSKIKKAQATHEKNIKKNGRTAVESHDKYIRDVQGLTNDIASAKSAHGTSVGSKTYLTSLAVASTMGGLADAEWKAHCEQVRKTGPHVGKLNEWLNFASSEAMANVQPPELKDDALGWAQVLAVRELEAREALNQQEKLRQAAIEQAQTAWKAEQMGWQPPPPASVQPTQQQAQAKESDKDLVSYANLPRLDSSGKVLAAEQTAPEKASLTAESPKEGKIEMTAVAVSRKPTIQSMTVTSEKWEEQPPAPEQTKSSTQHHAQESSVAEGTVIDRGQEEESKEEELMEELSAKPTAGTTAAEDTSRDQSSSDITPSLSNSASNLGSEDSTTDLGASRGLHPPVTPPDERSAGLFDRSKTIKEEEEEEGDEEEAQKQLKKSPTVGILKNKNEITSSPTKKLESSASKDLPLHRPLDRYVDSDTQRQDAGQAAAPTPTKPQFLTATHEISRPYATASLGRGFPPEIPDNKTVRSASQVGRSMSIWEREREREKQLERESDLQRRLAEAEDRLRTLDREQTAVAKGYQRDDVVAASAHMQQQQQSQRRAEHVASPRPRYSEPVQLSHSTYSEQGPEYERESQPLSHYEPERYAPSVGGSRLSNMSLNRTLSTDSERSFVARMKAHYQAEKEQRDRSRGGTTGFDRPLSPPTDLPSSMRSVTDLASNYQPRSEYATSAASVKKSSDGYGGYIYETNPSASNGVATGRGRYDSAPLARDEYGGYAVARQAGRPFPPAPPPRHPVAQQHQTQSQTQTQGSSAQPKPPVNYRRLSAPPVNPAASTLAASRKAGGNGLSGGAGEIYPRRSFEDGRRDEEQRRVAFVPKPQLVSWLYREIPLPLY